jgi:hypothetical protein
MLVLESEVKNTSQKNRQKFEEDEWISRLSSLA